MKDFQQEFLASAIAQTVNDSQTVASLDPTDTISLDLASLLSACSIPNGENLVCFTVTPDAKGSDFYVSTSYGVPVDLYNLSIAQLEQSIPTHAQLEHSITSQLISSHTYDDVPVLDVKDLLISLEELQIDNEYYEAKIEAYEKALKFYATGQHYAIFNNQVELVDTGEEADGVLNMFCEDYDLHVETFEFDLSADRSSDE